MWHSFSKCAMHDELLPVYADSFFFDPPESPEAEMSYFRTREAYVLDPQLNVRSKCYVPFQSGTERNEEDIASEEDGDGDEGDFNGEEDGDDDYVFSGRLISFLVVSPSPSSQQSSNATIAFFPGGTPGASTQASARS